MDHLTVLWLNAFALNLQRSVKMLAVEQTEPPYLDVKIEAIMLRVRQEEFRMYNLRTAKPTFLIHFRSSLRLKTIYI